MLQISNNSFFPVLKIWKNYRLIKFLHFRSIENLVYFKQVSYIKFVLGSPTKFINKEAEILLGELGTKICTRNNRKIPHPYLMRLIHRNCAQKPKFTHTKAIFMKRAWFLFMVNWKLLDSFYYIQWSWHWSWYIIPNNYYWHIKYNITVCL